MTRGFLTTAAACALMATGAAAQDAQNMINTDGITFQGGTVTFPSVTAAQDGYVVLHEVDENGNIVAPASIAAAPVSAGENMNVTTSADADLMRGQDYVAMLHEETNGNGTYDFAEGMTDVDTPVMVDGQPLTVRFTVPAEEQAASDDTATDAAMASDGDMAAGEGATADASDDAMASDNMPSGDMAADDMASEDMGEADTASDEPMMPEVVVEGARIQGDTLTLPRVVAAEDGYIVIHTILDGEPVVPASIGHAAVTAGVNENVEVTAEYPFAAGERYLAMLHVESNGNDTYDFGEGSTDVDTPVTMDGEIVAQSFQGG